MQKKTNQKKLVMWVEENVNLSNIISEIGENKTLGNRDIQDKMENCLEEGLETPKTINKKIFKISPLELCLVWPVTPEKKGKTFYLKNFFRYIVRKLAEYKPDKSRQEKKDWKWKRRQKKIRIEKRSNKIA